MRIVIVLVAGLALGCIPEYRAPTFDQPHATLKLKRSYGQSRGTYLAESLLVDGERAFEVTVPASVAAAPRTDTLLVHPRPARLQVISIFFHEETRAEEETRWVDVPYDDVETHDCGTFDAPQTCIGLVTRFSSEIHHETSYRTVYVTEAACHDDIALALAANAVYLVSFDFVGSGKCRLSCTQQRKQPDGTWSEKPCPPASEAVAKPQ